MSKKIKNSDVLKLIEKILNNITQELKQYSWVISLTPVGSFHYEKFKKSDKLKTTWDVDIIIILSEINLTIYNILEKFFSKLCKTYSGENFKFSSSFEGGPIKVPREKNKVSILLHCPTTLGKDWVNKSPLGKYSQQEHKPLLGTSLKKISKVDKITREMVLDSPIVVYN